MLIALQATVYQSGSKEKHAVPVHRLIVCVLEISYARLVPVKCLGCGYPTLTRSYHPAWLNRHVVSFVVPVSCAICCDTNVPPKASLVSEGRFFQMMSVYPSHERHCADLLLASKRHMSGAHRCCGVWKTGVPRQLLSDICFPPLHWFFFFFRLSSVLKSPANAVTYRSGAQKCKDRSWLL